MRITLELHLHPDFEYEILLQSLQFSLWDFTVPNELILPPNLSHHRLSLHLLNSTGPGEDNWQSPFIEQTGHDHMTPSNLIPLWNWACSKRDCINQTSTTAQQCLLRELQKTSEDSWHRTPPQQKSGLVLVNVSHLCPYSSIPFTTSLQTSKQKWLP